MEKFVVLICHHDQQLLKKFYVLIIYRKLVKHE